MAAFIARGRSSGITSNRFHSLFSDTWFLNGARVTRRIFHKAKVKCARRVLTRRMRLDRSSGIANLILYVCIVGTGHVGIICPRSLLADSAD